MLSAISFLTFLEPPSIAHQAVERWELQQPISWNSEEAVQASACLTVFFLARSPEAPNTMITVLSLSSVVLCVNGMRSALLDPYGAHFSTSHDM